MFRSLAVRNYRIWFFGALVSNIGAWMQATTQNGVVLTELTTHNASAVGVTMALQFGPQLLLVPFSGAVADRFERRHVLLVTQSLLMLFAAGLGVLLVTGQAELWHLYAFALGLGIVNAFDTTARQAFVSDLVGPANLSNAVALNSASFNSARLVGPAVAGVLIAVVGSGWVFMINAVSFLGVLGALLLIRTVAKSAPKANQRESQLRQLSAGLRYVRSRHDMIVVFVMVFLLGTFSMNFPVMSSTMAVEFGRGAGDYGLLSSILAIGSLTGALLVAKRPAARMRVVIIAAGGIGAVSVFAAVMPTFWTFALTLIFLGFAISTLLTTANGFVQTTTDPTVRGRVLALYVAVLMGGTPIGAPLVGAAADTLGARSTLVISAVAAFLAFGIGMTWLLVERQLRFHRDEGLRFTVTHVGRPGVDDDHAQQTETLTAPISVLRRDEELLVPGESAPQDGAVADATTGVILIDGIASEDEGDDPAREADRNP
ncbi:MFS transporter [Leucobacter coleopterorum]|uniref:MFS transporter n=1 Tax=Leucobacter coleopterorum TaxID=2714933 RepID=A0ABX6JZM0_9MICO|nr:MFS transporter [Leucobacter coleopterorum]QIM19779.1 MFS transporter [Leucobacter coleopterorum]